MAALLLYVTLSSLLRHERGPVRAGLVGALVSDRRNAASTGAFQEPYPEMEGRTASSCGGSPGSSCSRDLLGLHPPRLGRRSH